MKKSNLDNKELADNNGIIENKEDDNNTKNINNTKNTSVKKKKKKRSTSSIIMELLIKIFATAFVVIVLFIFVCGIYINHSNSSYPMIKDGDLCFTYKLTDLKQGYEIAYLYKGRIKFGRVIAVSGDEVTIKDKYVKVNGYSISEDVVYPTTLDGAKISFPYRVPDKTVFVLNDYREDILDSRTYGAIPLSNTRGRVVFIMRRRGI